MGRMIEFQNGCLAILNDYNEIKLYPEFDSAGNFVNGEWLHIAVTFNNLQLKIYINSINKVTKSFTLQCDAYQTAYIGHTNFPGREDLHAVIDELKIFDRYLSAEEIAAEMNTKEPFITFKI